MRIYAQREDGQCRVLVALKCDRCDAEIKPNRDIASSGWVKLGWDNGTGTEKFETDLCPECAMLGDKR